MSGSNGHSTAPIPPEEGSPPQGAQPEGVHGVCPSRLRPLGCQYETVGVFGSKLPFTVLFHCVYCLGLEVRVIGARQEPA